MSLQLDKCICACMCEYTCTCMYACMHARIGEHHLYIYRKKLKMNEQLLRE